MKFLRRRWQPSDEKIQVGRLVQIDDNVFRIMQIDHRTNRDGEPYANTVVLEAVGTMVESL